MKKIYLLLFFITAATYAQTPFITTWEATSGDLSITVPTNGTYTYNYTIDFGDGTVQNNVPGNANHTYAQPGIYTVTISGDFPSIYFNNGDAHDILSVEQWGDTEWETMEAAFHGCHNLAINATDAPDLSQVTSMYRMFAFATSLNQSLNAWDVSSVTNMSAVFVGNSSFNQPLDNWDVSNVTDMYRMFSLASSFNQPLNNWNVSSVTDMSFMFNGADSFNQSLNDWDVSNVTSMGSMFQSAYAFNQPLNDWNVSNVTSMAYMFSIAESFNRPLNDWDVSNVTDMSAMFQSTPFNQPLYDWDVSNVTNMSDMFSGAESFNQLLNEWDVSNVLIMDAMFNSASSFNQDLYDWDFNSLVNLHSGSNNIGFVAYSGMDVSNYDALLARFVQLGLQNKVLHSQDLYYCEGISRNTLINDLGWTILYDSLSDDCEMAVPENSLADIELYPVPTGNSLFIKIPAGTQLNQIEIFDPQGKKVKTIADSLQELNVKNLAAGYYFIKIYTTEDTLVKKFIKI